MPINPNFVGRHYESAEVYEVGRELIRRFADAIEDPNPLYRDPQAARAAGYPDVIAPPTFLTVLGFRYRDITPMDDPELGVDFSVVVHGQESFDLYRPVCAGDVLKFTYTVADVRVAGNNELMTNVIDVVAGNGEKVASITSTLVSRGTAPKGA